MKDAYWFSHDANARNDIKHIEMRSLYGWEGYGWYWMIVELMRESSDYKIPCRKRTFYPTMANIMGCSEETANQFIADCVEEFELFKMDGDFLWSDSLLHRMQIKDDIREKRSAAGTKAATKRWGTDTDEIPNVKQTHNKRTTNVQQNDAREKKERNKKKKEPITNHQADPAEALDLPAAIDEKDILFKQLDEAFLSQQPQQRFTNYGKERKHEKSLITQAMARAPDDPQDFLKRLLETFLEMTKNGDKFWKQQPFLPSVLNASGIFDRVLKQMENRQPVDDLSWVDEVINDSKRVR